MIPTPSSVLPVTTIGSGLSCDLGQSNQSKREGSAAREELWTLSPLLSYVVSWDSGSHPGWMEARAVVESSQQWSPVEERNVILYYLSHRVKHSLKLVGYSLFSVADITMPESE